MRPAPIPLPFVRPPAVRSVLRIALVCVASFLTVSFFTAGQVGAWGGGAVSVGEYTVPGESFVFCIDRSCSMTGTPLHEVKALIGASLDDLEPSQRFSLVTFSDITLIFSTTLLPANPTNVADAQVWLNSISAQGTTAMGPALVTSLNILQGAPNPALILTADGLPNSPGPSQTLAMAVAANSVAMVPSSCVRLTTVFDGGAIAFLQQLASATGGVFIDLTVPPPNDPFLRGDANGDGTLNLADPILILQVGFGLTLPSTCSLSHDVNGEGMVTPVADAISALSNVFLAGPPPPAPYPDCGIDPDVLDVSLTCDSSTCS